MIELQRLNKGSYTQASGSGEVLFFYTEKECDIVYSHMKV